MKSSIEGPQNLDTGFTETVVVNAATTRSISGANTFQNKVPTTEDLRFTSTLDACERLQTTESHLSQINGVLDIIAQRRQTNNGEEGIPWTGRDGFLRKAVELTRSGEPLLLTFPGFPFKSANHVDKTLGCLPDQCEKLSLKNLNEMLEQMNRCYPGGCKLLIVSDGMPFGPMFRVPDVDIHRYYDCMRKLAEGTLISFTCMTDLIAEGDTIEDKRRILVERYAKPPEITDAKIANDPETTRYFAGLKHFLEGDLGRIWIAEEAEAGRTLSKNALRRLASQTARDFIRVNDAFNALVAEAVPPALRLSVHPQAPDNPAKVGIELTFGTQRRAWGTPWQNALVLRANGEWDLTRKGEAQKNGWELVYVDGEPSHFREAA